MKKRTRIILNICAVVICIAIILLSPSVLGKPLYLPMRVEAYYYEDDSSEGYMRTSVDYKYSLTGHLQELVRTSSFESVPITVDCDRNGNLLSFKSAVQVSPDFIDSISESYTYTPTGKPLTINRNETLYERTYNLRGLLTNVKRTRGNGTYVVNINYTYNAIGKLLSAQYYKVNGKEELLYATTKYEYDLFGRMKHEVWYNQYEKPRVEVYYSYNGHQTIADITRYSTESDQQIHCVFDHAGNLISYQYSDGMKYTFVYTYKVKFVSIFSPRNAYVYHYTLPETGITAWFDNVNS